jgi:Family of unknown function (DUF5681)
MPFEPGQSGNPAGRPPGSRNKRKIMVEKLLDEHVEKLMRRGINLADAGDSMVLRLFLQRILPRSHYSPVAFELPPIETAADALAAMNKIRQGLADGELTTAQATELAALVQFMSKVVVDTDHEQLIQKLEAAAAQMTKAK